MICGNCHQKISDIELYCKLCGADLQIFSSEKYSPSAKADKKDKDTSVQQTEKLQEDTSLPFVPQESITSFISPSSTSFVNEATQLNPTETLPLQNNNFDLNIPNIPPWEKKDTLSNIPSNIPGMNTPTPEEPKEKPLYNRYFLDEEDQK